MTDDGEVVAYKCEVNNHGWSDFISRKHPDEVFEHLSYRNVRPLVYGDANE